MSEQSLSNIIRMRAATPRRTSRFFEQARQQAAGCTGRPLEDLGCMRRVLGKRGVITPDGRCAICRASMR